MYYMICGEFPFKGEELEDKIRYDYLEFASSRWRHVEHEAKDLLRELLTKKPEFRYSAGKALDHSYFAVLRERESQKPTSPFSKEILNNMREF